MKKHLSFFFFFLFFLNSISVAFAAAKPEEKSLVAVVPDITLIYQMIIFGILIWILNILLYKPILSIIDRRKKQLEESENEIKLFNESVEKRVAEYEEKLKQAKLKASEQKKEIIQEGANQAKNIVDAVRNEIPVIAREFQQKMDKEVERAKQILDGYSKDLSLQIAQKILGRPVQ
ncbi:MAG TPA: ATP synthase F0 subunit B [Smithella sp.]|nr:ATP synthase F0 subunit B [Smithella sp.]